MLPPDVKLRGIDPPVEETGAFMIKLCTALRVRMALPPVVLLRGLSTMRSPVPAAELPVLMVTLLLPSNSACIIEAFTLAAEAVAVKIRGFVPVKFPPEVTSAFTVT